MLIKFLLEKLTGQITEKNSWVGGGVGLWGLCCAGWSVGLNSGYIFASKNGRLGMKHIFMFYLVCDIYFFETENLTFEFTLLNVNAFNSQVIQL